MATTFAPITKALGGAIVEVTPTLIEARGVLEDGARVVELVLGVGEVAVAVGRE